MHADPDFRLWAFHGAWSHTAEMYWNQRLPRALARFGLRPPHDVPRVVPDHDRVV